MRKHFTLSGKSFKVTEHINIKLPNGEPSPITLPLLDIPQLSDIDWQTLCEAGKESLAV